jgi:hypothetical protein
VVLSDKKGGANGQHSAFDDDIRSENNNAFMCKEHANAAFEKFCCTCH